jgi:Domain of unknown function (DUF5615)
VPQHLYLDECTAVLLTEQLRRLDPESATLLSIEHASQRARGQSDPQQLKHAVRQRAVFITHNIRDFYWLHRWWKTLLAWELLSEPHNGILAVPNSLRIEVTAAAIISLLIQSPGPVLANNMYIYKQGQWIREQW